MLEFRRDYTMIPISSIIIGKRYRKVSGDITKLADSIREIGLLHPIVINEKNELIAGKRRIEAFKILGRDSIPATKLNLSSLMRGELDENTIRKDFTTEEIGDIIEVIEKHKSPGRPAKGAKLAPFPKGKTASIVAKISGRSHGTIKKIKTIVKEKRKGNKKAAQLLGQIDNGKITIDKAYRQTRNEIKKEQTRKAIRRTQVSLPDTVQLYQKKFQFLEIRPNSISMIFTDPPYAEKYLHLYDDLGKQAIQVLRDGGSLLCYAGHFAIGRIINMMENHGLKFHWPLVVCHSGPSASVFGYRVLVGYKPLLWFTKGKYQGEFVRDVIKSEFQGKELHEWAQSTIESDYYIKYMTIPNDIVYDPFMGQGTFGISAIKLKRQFIGAEIDATHFKNAQRILTNANKTIDHPFYVGQQEQQKQDKATQVDQVTQDKEDNDTTKTSLS